MGFRLRCRRWLARGQEGLNLLEQAGEFEWFSFVFIAARLQGLFPISLHGMGGYRDDRDAPN